MINAHNSAGHCMLHVEGDVTEVVADISTIIGHIYAQTKAANPEAAAQLRYLLTAGVLSPDSPVWTMTPDDTATTVVEKVDKPAAAEEREG